MVRVTFIGHDPGEAIVGESRPGEMFRGDEAGGAGTDYAAEARSRRRGWTQGVVVQLADGRGWLLPRVDIPLLITTPGLQDDLIATFRLIHDMQGEVDETKGHVINLVHYHGHMANVGIRLLQVNYDLPEAEWKSLLAFDTIFPMLTFTRAVSELIGDSAGVWMPFYLTHGPDGADFLVCN